MERAPTLIWEEGGASTPVPVGMAAVAVLSGSRCHHRVVSREWSVPFGVLRSMTLVAAAAPQPRPFSRLRSEVPGPLP